MRQLHCAWRRQHFVSVLLSARWRCLAAPVAECRLVAGSGWQGMLFMPLPRPLAPIRANGRAPYTHQHPQCEAAGGDHDGFVLSLKLLSLGCLDVAGRRVLWRLLVVSSWMRWAVHLMCAHAPGRCGM